MQTFVAIYIRPIKLKINLVGYLGALRIVVRSNFQSLPKNQFDLNIKLTPHFKTIDDKKTQHRYSLINDADIHTSYALMQNYQTINTNMNME